MNSQQMSVVCLSLLLAAVIVTMLVGCPQFLKPSGRTDTSSRPGAVSVLTIRQIGSTTVLPLAEKWREAFNAEHPNVEIAVSGGGSGTGIKALLSGSAEIADASRPIKDQERKAAEAAGIHPTEHIVAYDGLAVIVHPSNPVTELSVEQLSDIFVGKIRQWREVGGTGGDIVLINRDSSSGTWEAFKNLVVTLNGTAKDRDYAPEALAAPSNQAVLDLVASTKAAIGYVGLSYLNERVKALWITPVGGGAPVPPTVANVQNRSYPISRALYCYTNGEPIGKLGEYIQWIKGPEGQAIVEQLGYVPLPE